MGTLVFSLLVSISGVAFVDGRHLWFHSTWIERGAYLGLWFFAQGLIGWYSMNFETTSLIAMLMRVLPYPSALGSNP